MTDKRVNLDTLSVEIMRNFDEPQAAFITLLFGRIAALENLWELLATVLLADSYDPMEGAMKFKDEILGLIDYDPGDPIQDETQHRMVEALDKLIRRVETL